MITLHKVSKVYARGQRPALDDVTVDIAQVEFFGIDAQRVRGRGLRIKVNEQHMAA